MRRSLLVVALALLVAAPLLTGARADEEPNDLVVRVVPVGSLVAGRWNFTREQAPIVWPWAVSDTEHPLFGGVGEEPLLPVGSVDELMDLVRMSVEPPFWEERLGARIDALGGDRLVVRATPEIQAQVRALLDELQVSLGQTATVELRWVRVAADVAAPLLGSDDPLVLASDDAGRLLEAWPHGPGVSVTAFSGQRAAVTGGRQIAWLADGDVEVAQEAQTTDPIVSVSNLGFMAQVMPILQADGALLGIDAALAEQGATRAIPTERNGRFEAPTNRVVIVRPVIHVPYGAWAVAEGRRVEGGEAWWLLLARVSRNAYETVSGHAVGIDLGRPMRYQAGEVALRTFGVQDLGQWVGHRSGEAIHLWPSNYAGAAVPELPEAEATVDPERLVELLYSLAEDETWEDPASIEARGGVLLMRNRPEVLAQLERQLGRLRERSLWTLVTTAEVVEIPASLGVQMGAACVLDEQQQRFLDEIKASGQARTIDALRLTNFRDRRNFVRAGERVAYLQDYEVEIAQAAEIGNPVFIDVFSGAQLDLRPARSPDGGSVHLNVEFVRSDLERPLRTHSTTQGDVELPAMEIFRLRTGLQVPLGRTALAGTWTEGDRCRLLLLTPRLKLPTPVRRKSR